MATVDRQKNRSGYSGPGGRRAAARRRAQSAVDAGRPRSRRPPGTTSWLPSRASAVSQAQKAARSKRSLVPRAFPSALRGAASPRRCSARRAAILSSAAKPKWNTDHIASGAPARRRAALVQHAPAASRAAPVELPTARVRAGDETRQEVSSRFGVGELACATSPGASLTVDALAGPCHRELDREDLIQVRDGVHPGARAARPKRGSIGAPVSHQWESFRSGKERAVAFPTVPPHRPGSCRRSLDPPPRRRREPTGAPGARSWCPSAVGTGARPAGRVSATAPLGQSAASASARAVGARPPVGRSDTSLIDEPATIPALRCRRRKPRLAPAAPGTLRPRATRSPGRAETPRDSRGAWPRGISRPWRSRGAFAHSHARSGG